jgi:hypothetical protein
MSHPILRLFDGFENTSPDLQGEVKELQQELRKEGFEVDVDGQFGRDTEAAVKSFQREHGLDDDGVVGAITWAALLQVEPLTSRAGLQQRMQNQTTRYWSNLRRQIHTETSLMGPQRNSTSPHACLQGLVPENRTGGLPSSRLVRQEPEISLPGDRLHDSDWAPCRPMAGDTGVG